MKRSHLILYLLLNVIVSAATTLTVITIWDRIRHAEVPPPPQTEILPGVDGTPMPNPIKTNAVAGASAEAEPQPTDSPTVAEPALTPTLPPLDQPVIQILSVVGAGDLDAEVVMLKRQGEGNLTMTGWKLEGEKGNRFTFPEQPELVLYKDGNIQVHSGAGENSAVDIYWGRTRPAWTSGESIRLLDPQDNERATYRVP